MSAWDVGRLAAIGFDVAVVSFAIGAVRASFDDRLWGVVAARASWAGFVAISAAEVATRIGDGPWTWRTPAGIVAAIVGIVGLDYDLEWRRARGVRRPGQDSRP